MSRIKGLGLELQDGEKGFVLELFGGRDRGCKVVLWAQSKPSLVGWHRHTG